MNSFKLGIIAEYIASFIYKIFFYQILHRRYKTYVGEIDFIALRTNTLVFVEVKARKYNLHDRIISDKQINRIRNAAELFLSKNIRFNKYNIRFDFVLVRPYKLPIIIKNAW